MSSNSTSSSKSVLIISAEASSNLFALRLLQQWKVTRPDLKAYGVGNQEMMDLGFTAYGRAEEMAVFGLFEVLSKYSLIKAVFYKILEVVDRDPPQVAILMDYPGFNLKLAKELHSRGIKVVYYIAPQIWAWKQGRVHQIRKYCDKVLCLFSFEDDFFKLHQVSSQFVGHPLLDEISDEISRPGIGEKAMALKKSKCGFEESDLVLGLMPGSRRGEIERNFPVQLQVAGELVRKFKNLRIVVLAAPSVSTEQLEPYLEDVRFPYKMIKDEPFQMIQVPDLVLATSGTATLFVGLLRKPMAIMYRLNWLTAIIGKIIVRGVKFFGLPNIILGEEVAKEFFQWNAVPKKIVPYLSQFIESKKLRDETISKLATIPIKLGSQGVTVRVDDSLTEYLGPKLLRSEGSSTRGLE